MATTRGPPIAICFLEADVDCMNSLSLYLCNFRHDNNRADVRQHGHRTGPGLGSQGLSMHHCSPDENEQRKGTQITFYFLFFFLGWRLLVTGHWSGQPVVSVSLGIRTTDFLLCEFMKSKVFTRHSRVVEDLKQHMRNAFYEITVKYATKPVAVQEKVEKSY